MASALLRVAGRVSVVARVPPATAAAAAAALAPRRLFQSTSVVQNEAAVKKPKADKKKKKDKFADSDSSSDPTQSAMALAALKEMEESDNAMYEMALEYIQQARQNRGRLQQQQEADIVDLQKTIDENEAKLKLKPKGGAEVAALEKEIARLTKRVTKFKEYVELHKSWISRTEPSYEAYVRSLRVTEKYPDVRKMSNDRWRYYREDDRMYNLAVHWKVMRDVFPEHDFHPKTNVAVYFGERSAFHGNKEDVRDLLEEPKLAYSLDSDKLSTVLMIDADAPNLATSSLAERVHWLVCNLPKTVSASTSLAGSTVVDFVPPHPEKGTGFHRILFIVFEHQEKIDLSDVVQGKERFINTTELIKKFNLEPSGLAFLRTEWEPTVSEIYKNVLCAPEPEYALPERIVKATDVPSITSQVLSELKEAEELETLRKKRVKNKTNKQIQRLQEKEEIIVDDMGNNWP